MPASEPRGQAIRRVAAKVMTPAGITVLATVVTALATAILAVITAYYASLTHETLAVNRRTVALAQDSLTLSQNMAKSQIEPQVEFGFALESIEMPHHPSGPLQNVPRDHSAPTPSAGVLRPRGPARELTIRNNSPFDILDVSVDWSAMYVKKFHERPGRAAFDESSSGGDYPVFWRIAKLTAGEVQRRPVTDVVQFAAERAAAHRAQLFERLALPPGWNRYTETRLVILRLTFHRDFDRKRYRMLEAVLVYDDPNVLMPAYGFPWSPNVARNLARRVQGLLNPERSRQIVDREDLEFRDEMARPPRERPKPDPD